MLCLSLLRCNLLNIERKNLFLLPIILTIIKKQIKNRIKPQLFDAFFNEIGLLINSYTGAITEPEESEAVNSEKIGKKREFCNIRILKSGM